MPDYEKRMGRDTVTITVTGRIAKDPQKANFGENNYILTIAVNPRGVSESHKGVTNWYTVTLFNPSETALNIYQKGNKVTAAGRFIQTVFEGSNGKVVQNNILNAFVDVVEFAKKAEDAEEEAPAPRPKAKFKPVSKVAAAKPDEGDDLPW